MKTIIIKKENLATRCELCHQRDCFDAEKNICFRCENVSENELDTNQQRYGRYFSRSISHHIVTSKIARQMQTQNPREARKLLRRIIGDEGITIHSLLLMAACLLVLIHQHSLVLSLVVVIPILVSLVFGFIVAYLYRDKNYKW